MFNNFLNFLKKFKLGIFYLIFSTWQIILNKENIEIIYIYERDINWVDTVKWGIIAIIIVLGVLLLVAYAILLERKVLGSIQKRRGPNLVGIFGLLQPIADAVKLIVKETIIPVLSNRIIFIIAPLLTLILSLLNWSIIPFSNHAVLADIRVSILMFFAISSLSVYGIIMSGWASNSKYAFLGALRAAAQVIAYEVSIGLTLIYILIQTSDLNYFKIIWSQLDIWNIIPCFIFFFLFFISTLAETNRPPFDLPEAEAELVSGYNVEYSAMSFGFFFLGEYVSIWTVCCLNIILFWGGFLIYTYESIFIYSLKVIMLVITFIWVRGSLPRYRYDQLMRLGWKILLPISLGFVILYAGVYYDLLYTQLITEYDYYMNNILIEGEFYLTGLELSSIFVNVESLVWYEIFNNSLLHRLEKYPEIIGDPFGVYLMLIPEEEQNVCLWNMFNATYSKVQNDYFILTIFEHSKNINSIAHLTEKEILNMSFLIDRIVFDSIEGPFIIMDCYFDTNYILEDITNVLNNNEFFFQFDDEEVLLKNMNLLYKEKNPTRFN